MSGKEKIVDIDIDKEMSNSFLEYAYSVIYSRALPDARDGLKPVQRRIVYQMNQMGLLPDKSFVKSARVVGDVMGKLHPHGDAAIYDAMVRLAQDFSVKLPLVIGHGNFGSLHDSPAAPRYTEAKLSQYSLLLCKDIEENTVDFLPNYDNKLKEPEVLPASFPNLLVNGSSGIAVGMATNIPSHNLNEVLQACIYLIENPGCQISDLQKYILGPDFPGGAIITNKQVLREIYNTGRGLLKVRAKPNIEIQGKRKSIVFTELPYLVDPERIISKIKDFINSGKISGISAVGDFTDRKRGLRLQIDIKSGYDEKNVLAQLYKWTPLEETFGVNLVALVNGHPQTLNLKQALAVWIKHRIEVLKRRSKYRLEMAENRLHLVGGLQIAINSIDKVIKIIRNSQTQDDAKKQLKTDFSLDDLQANYILDLRLRKLTKFSRIELEKENADLKKTIANLSSILSSDKKIQSLLIEEINQVKDSYSSPRKTSFIKKTDSLLSVNEDDIISPTQNQIVENSKNGESTNLAGKDGFVLLTSSGKTAFIEDDNLKKSDLAEFNLEVIQEKNFNSPNILQNILQRDAFKQIIKINLSSDLLVLLSDGYFTRLQVSSLPNINKLNDLENNNFAYKLDSILELENNKTSLAFWQNQANDSQTLACATKKGKVMRIKSFSAPKSDSFIGFNLDDDDVVCQAKICYESDKLVFITANAQLLVFPASKVRPQGKGSGGMAGIKLSDDNLIAFSSVKNKNEAHILTAAGQSSALPGLENGFVKVSPLEIYPEKGRSTGGVRCQRFLKGQDKLIFAEISEFRPRAWTSKGQKISLPEISDKRDGAGQKIDYPIAYAN